MRLSESPAHVPLVAAMRGDTVESVHYGSIAVVNSDGELRHSLGAPGGIVFPRSSLKPLQVIPLLEHPDVGEFAFSQAEIAIFCGSHSGEPRHAETVLAVLDKIGCRKEDLKCGVHVPLYYEALGQRPLRDDVFTLLQNNCSGKHAAMLALCRLMDVPLADYLQPEHPVQCAIKAAIAEISACEQSDIIMAVDGCSAPTFALPLTALAYAFSQLAGVSSDSHSTTAIFNAMATHPEMVSGLRRLDLALTAAGDGAWVSKSGAEGVEALAIQAGALGVAIKIADGSERARNVASIEVMRQLALIGDPQGLALGRFSNMPVTSWNGSEVGELRPMFDLVS